MKQENEKPQVANSFVTENTSETKTFTSKKSIRCSKIFIKFMFAVFVFGFAVTSCNEKNNATEPKEPKNNPFVGTWYQVGSTEDNGVKVVFSEKKVDAIRYAPYLGQYSTKFYDDAKYEIISEDIIKFQRHPECQIIRFGSECEHNQNGWMVAYAFISKDTLWIDKFVRNTFLDVYLDSTIFGSIMLYRAGSDLQDDNSLDGEWTCVPELHPDIKFTLTFDEDKAYISSSPQNLWDITNPYLYILENDERGAHNFTVSENESRLCYIMENPPCNSGFNITFLSNDTISLKYFGGAITYSPMIFEYIFTKNK